MAGLLGDSWDDPKTLGVLAAAGALASGRPLGQGLLGAVQAYSGLLGEAQDRKTKKAYTDSQIAENASQAELRQLQALQMRQNMAEDAAMLGLGQGRNAAALGPAGMAQGGSAPAGAVSPQLGGWLGAIAQQLNIPPEQVLADRRFNGGKGIGGYINDRTKPDWNVQNGFAFNKNALTGPGFIPQLNISSNGQATQVQVGADGLPVVSAPRGAMDAYAGYKQADTGIAARATPQKFYDPETKTERIAPLSSVLGLPGYGNESQMRATMQGEMGANPDALSRELQGARQSLQEAKTPQERQALGDWVSTLERDQARMRGQGASPNAGTGRGFAAGPSAADKASQDASANFTQGVAKTAGDAFANSFAGAQSAATVLQNVGQIRSGLGNAILGPGANARVSLLQIGQTLGVGGKDAQEQLVNTRNVIQGLARQELSASAQIKGQGQVTESERALLQRAESGNISDFTPVELNSLLNVVDKTARYRINQHQQSMNSLQNGGKFEDLLNVQAPSAAPAQNAQTDLRSLAAAELARRKGQR